MADDNHVLNKKLHKNKAKLHNCSTEDGNTCEGADKSGDNLRRSADVKDGIYEWYGPTGKLYSALV
jgi:hypothetical protein